MQCTSVLVLSCYLLKTKLLKPVKVEGYCKIGACFNAQYVLSFHNLKFPNDIFENLLLCRMHVFQSILKYYLNLIRLIFAYRFLKKGATTRASQTYGLNFVVTVFSFLLRHPLILLFFLMEMSCNRLSIDHVSKSIFPIYWYWAMYLVMSCGSNSSPSYVVNLS